MLLRYITAALCACCISLPIGAQQPQHTPFYGLDVPVILQHSVSSATAQTGDEVIFRPTSSYAVNGITYIQAGVDIIGHVDFAHPVNKQKCDDGVLNVSIRMVLPNGLKVFGHYRDELSKDESGQIIELNEQQESNAQAVRDTGRSVLTSIGILALTPIALPSYLVASVFTRCHSDKFVGKEQILTTGKQYHLLLFPDYVMPPASGTKKNENR